MTEQITTQSLDRLKLGLLAELRHRVAEASDRRASDARQLAGRLAEIQKLDLTQVRGVENLAHSTDKVSDLTDLLKKWIGRDGKGERWAQGGVGQSLLGALEGLREQANQIADGLQKYKPPIADDPQSLPPKDAEALRQYRLTYDDLPRRIHLLLCREYARHLTANFEYLRSGKEES